MLCYDMDAVLATGSMFFQMAISFSIVVAHAAGYEAVSRV